MAEKKFEFGDFNNPNRCDFCREEISSIDVKNGLVLHVKRAPRRVIHADTGEVLGIVQEGPPNRYLHARPCAETYSNAQLICTACNFWRASTRGGGLCICRCHPPISDKQCRFHDNDLERAGGK